MMTYVNTGCIYYFTTTANLSWIIYQKGQHQWNCVRGDPQWRRINIERITYVSSSAPHRPSQYGATMRARRHARNQYSVWTANYRVERHNYLVSTQFVSFEYNIDHNNNHRQSSGHTKEQQSGKAGAEEPHCRVHEHSQNTKLHQ